MTEPIVTASGNNNAAVPPSEQQPLVGVRGWLLVFSITLFLRATLSLFLSLQGIYSGDRNKITGGLMYLVLAGICLIAGIQICRRKKGGIWSAIASMLLTTAYGVLMIIGAKNEAGWRYLFQSVVYMGIWWTYLVKSERVKATLTL